MGSSGLPAAGIAQPDIAAAYIPLYEGVDLGLANVAAAAVVIAPGIAVTNAHNANLLDPKLVIGTAKGYDLLFFHTGRRTAPQTAEPAPGESVVAYGQGRGDRLRLARGVVREIATCPGCGAPAYFTFAGNAGPGFSGGPVIDSRTGRLVGITFGYKDVREGHERLIYAYDMARVRAELAGVEKALPRDAD